MVKKNLRLWIQCFCTILSNSNFKGFFEGKIYTGKLKNLCLPGLNCYSCPGSLGSCPIGALQAVLSTSGFKFSFYLLGFFLIIGTFLGRVVCGFLCPFGLVQDLLNKIPFFKKIHTFKFDKHLRLLKYIILIIFVILMPLFVVDFIGGGSPWFCKLICPAGTFEAGIPLVLSNPLLRSAISFLFAWKVFILIITILLSIIIYRPFCKYICPLGAIYSLFNKVSIYRYDVDKNLCINCNKCTSSCPMNICPHSQTNHAECIRCGDCKKVCPTGAICSGFSCNSSRKTPEISK